MSRQINLYSSAFRPQAKRFSAVWTVVAVVAIAAVTLAYYAWEARQLQAQRARRSDAGVQLKKLQEQLITLAKSVQKPKDKALEDQVARAESLLNSRQDLYARLQGGEIGNRDGYANFLTALARQRLDGVWLTGIEVSGPGGEFALEGRTLRADLLPGYIKMLRNEVALKGKPIATLAMREREIDTKGELKPQRGPAVPVESGPAGQSAAVRVVEFRIGTAAGTDVTADAGGAGR